MKAEFKQVAIVVAVVLYLILLSATGFTQDPPKPRRLKFKPGTNIVIVNGLVGGEWTDYYLIRAKAGRRLVVRTTSPQKLTRVGVSNAVGEDDLKDQLDRSDQTRWEGTVPRWGDYLISVNVYPGSEHYTLRIMVK